MSRFQSNASVMTLVPGKKIASEIRGKKGITHDFLTVRSASAQYVN